MDKEQPVYVLFADSDCDITPEKAKDFGYTAIIPMPFTMDGKTVYPYRDMEDFDVPAFYRKLEGGSLPITDTVSVEEYEELFSKEFEKGNDILYIHFSEAMSETFANMRLAQTELKKKYPERTLYDVDTKGIAVLSYGILEEAGKLYKKGISAPDLVKWVQEQVPHWTMYLFADNLSYFKKSGRVSGISATMGSILGIRPIIWITPEGKMETLTTERGREKAVDSLVNMVVELGEDFKHHKIYIGHANAPEFVEEAKQGLYEKLGRDIRIETVLTNPTAGSHCGPNSMGIAFYCAHR